FQYSPPLRIEDLLSLQVDQDNDWQLEAEPDVLNGKPNGIDDDGDGFVDEPSDDWDGNFYPSGDFDGFAEADVGSPMTLENGIDDDQDGNTRDQATNSEDVDGRMRRLPVDPNDHTSRPRDETEIEVRSGMVVEGNGQDDDKDGLVDDLGDFNGDALLAYDPEWHVSEDSWGDQSGDGYPGLGADIDADENSAEGDIIAEPQRRDDLVVTSFADDDWDGYADFYDPQVLAAMYAPEMDGLDNDGDGAVDEVGERYIAAYDDDEDGRYDEDPPEFQIALNLYDYIDTWAPYTPTEDPDVRQLLSKNEDDVVLSDPVTFQTFNLYSSRQRAFRMHPRLFAGPNRGSRDIDLFDEEMRLMLPNPPQLGMKVQFEGVESIRINEVMAKPVIRLEMEDVLATLEYDPNDPSVSPTATLKRGRFVPERSGIGDDGQIPLAGYPIDTSWALNPNPATGKSFPHLFLPNGFVNTFNPMFSIANLDAMAPAVIFMVTNVKPQPLADKRIGTQPEIATWKFENIPAGYYDVVVYLHPSDGLNPLVNYYFNSNKPIPMKSDMQVIVDNAGVKTVQDISTISDAFTREVIRRDTARYNNGIDAPGELKLPYRLTYWPGDANDFSKRFSDPRVGRVQVRTDGKLDFKIEALTPDPTDANAPQAYVTSIDRIELINPFAQYVELVNIGLEDVNLSGWTINTPYGHYVIPDDDQYSVIKRMKPAWKEDDGTELKQGDGLPGAGVPFEPMMDEKTLGNPLGNNELRVEDNKMLLVNNPALFKSFLNDNYAKLDSDAEKRILAPELASSEQKDIEDSLDNFLDPTRK
ncbi:hypothetical protein K8I31_16650, partial [bacterium]|nr:hypothetical protein [bacterium]